jgi:Arm DNA-binding domain
VTRRGETGSPATTGRADYRDAVVPGLALRVTERGHKSFLLVARYPSNPKNPTRRLIGEYGSISLDQARQKARRWLELIGKGVGPKIEAERKREARDRVLTDIELRAICGCCAPEPAGD